MNPTTRTTARAARLAAKERVARRLLRALADLDLTQGELAHAIGVTPQIVQRWCDRDHGATITAADLLVAPREVAMALLREVAEPHHAQVVDELATEPRQEPLSALVLAINAVETEYAAALADGVLSRAERMRLREAIRPLVESLMRLDGWCAERVVS